MNINRYREKIEKFIDLHLEEMIEDVMTLIRIKSVKEEAREGMPFGKMNAAILMSAHEMLEKYGFDVRNYDNYVVVADINKKKPMLDILGHLDVVGAENNWSVTEPFRPIILGKKIYGRGAADDKGPVIAAIYALRAIKELNIPLSHNVRLILGVDEESGSDDIAYYYQKEKEAPMTISPDAEFPLVNIEKGILHGVFDSEYPNQKMKKAIQSIHSGNEINVIPSEAVAFIQGIEQADINCMQSITKRTNISFRMEQVKNKEHIIKIIAEGKSCHAATPECGSNALTGLLELLSNSIFADCEGYCRVLQLNKLFPHNKWDGSAMDVDMEDTLSGGVTLNLTLLDYNMEAFKGGFDCRTPLCATNENLRDVISSKMAQYNIYLGNRGIYAPHHVHEESEFVQTLLSCYELYSGKKEKPLTIGGGTYVHAISNGVAFGCADINVDNHMHGPDEFMEISQLVISAKIYAEAIIRLCGTDNIV